VRSLLLGWCSVVVFACGCSGASNLPVAPTPTASAPALAPTPTLPLRDSGNWTPFFFARWQPGIGTSLGLNATIPGHDENLQPRPDGRRWTKQRRSWSRLLTLLHPHHMTRNRFRRHNSKQPKRSRHRSRHNRTISTTRCAKFLRRLAPQAGFEPATLRLTG